MKATKLAEAQCAIGGFCNMISLLWIMVPFAQLDMILILNLFVRRH